MSKHSIQLNYFKEKGFNLYDPENLDQLLYVQSLLDPSIKVVFNLSKSGSGKTSLAALSGYYLAIEQELYQKLGYIRTPIETAGRALGFLPGDLSSKIGPHMAAFEQNLPVQPGGLEKLVQFEKVEMEVTSFLRGVTKKSYLIADECQNMSTHELITLLSRIYIGSNKDDLGGKIVLLGDPGQVDDPKLERYGPKKLTPFEVMALHFEGRPGVARHTLNKSRRGWITEVAESVHDTIEKVKRGEIG